VSKEISVKHIFAEVSPGTDSTAAEDRTGGAENYGINPMDQVETRLRNLKRAPRCGARNRAGNPCQNPAIRGRRRCRLHGGLSTGAPPGPANGNFKHGDLTVEAMEHRKWLRSLVKSVIAPEEG
jgi:glucans biosynthesis protein